MQNQAQLNSYKTPADFAKNFTFTDDNWKQFTTVAAKDSIPLNFISGKEKTQIINRIKSSFARQVWRNEGFYEISNTQDKAVLKSIELLSK